MLTFTENINFFMAFGAGLLSFFSPCIFSLLPSYLLFMSGVSANEFIKQDVPNKIRKRTLFSTLAYVLGFSTVFILMGVAASFVGKTFFNYLDIVKKIGGVVIIIFGLHFINVIKLSFLNFEKRVNQEFKPVSLVGFFIVGMCFAAGWTPCIGPILGSILILAGTKGELLTAIYLLGLYSIGLGLPFIVLAFFINYVFTFIKKANRALKYITVISGALLIIIGIMMLFDQTKLIGI